MTAVSQEQVNATVHILCAHQQRMEDAIREIEKAMMASDAAIARLTGKETVKCPRCRVTVDVDKLDLPGRCGDSRCPLNKENRDQA